MSSIVADVLQGAGKLLKENIVLKVSDLKRKLEDIKLEVQERLKTRYIEFYPQYVKLDKLIDDINGVTSEYEVLHTQIEKEIKPLMHSSVVEFSDVVEDLKKIRKLKTVGLSLCLLHQHLEDAKRAFSQCTYLNSVICLLHFESVLKDIDAENQKYSNYICSENRIYYHKRGCYLWFGNSLA
ncbi:hypothetical protein TNCV_1835171 [Trichonephila clavipes]|nr:hypothetical protein TNCV_1835171 [Trichonephila clavipes]